VTLTNTGPIAGIPVIRVEGTNADEFTFTNFPVEDGGCDTSTPVAPGANCMIWAQFVPLRSGSKSAVLKVANAKVITMTGSSP